MELFLSIFEDSLPTVGESLLPDERRLHLGVKDGVFVSGGV